MSTADLGSFFGIVKATEEVSEEREEKKEQEEGLVAALALAAVVLRPQGSKEYIFKELVNKYALQRVKLPNHTKTSIPGSKLQRKI